MLLLCSVISEYWEYIQFLYIKCVLHCYPYISSYREYQDWTFFLKIATDNQSQPVINAQYKLITKNSN